MDSKDGISQELVQLIENLTRLEGSWSEDVYRATKITGSAKNIISFLPELTSVNVIPSNEPGPWFPILLVIIGQGDDVEKTIVQAIEHLTIQSHDMTRSVLFWSMKWDSAAWLRCSQGLRDVTVVLRLFFTGNIKLA